MTDLGWSIADVRSPLTGARRGRPFLRAGKNHLWDGAAKDKQWRPRLAQARWKTPTLYYTAIGCTVAVDECDGDVWFWSPERKTLCADISCARSRKYKPQQKRIRCSDPRRFKPQRRRGLQFPLLQRLRLFCFTLESPAKVIPNLHPLPHHHHHPCSPTDAPRTWKIDSLLVGLIRCLITLSPTGKSSTTAMLFQPASEPTGR